MDPDGLGEYPSKKQAALRGDSFDVSNSHEQLMLTTALAQINLGHFKKGEATLKKIVGKNKFNFNAIFKLANYYYIIQSDHEKASSILEESIQSLEKITEDFLYQRTLILLEDDKLKEAKELVKTYSKKYPSLKRLLKEYPRHNILSSYDYII